MASVVGAGSSEQPQLKGTARGDETRSARQRLNGQPKSQNYSGVRSVGRMIEREIIPRLIIAHSSAATSERANGSGVMAPELIEEFTFKALSSEADELVEFVDKLLANGMAAETIFVELLAPTARRLGVLWEEDACDFVDVTMGLWRLQEVMRDVARRSPSIMHGLAGQYSALFASMPGDQHSFGALMVEECFARAGWDTQLLVGAERSDLLNRIGECSFDLVGLTVSCDCHIEPLTQLITAVRSVSKNSDVKIMVGGTAFNTAPERVSQVGADGFAPTARKAIESAEELVGGPALQAYAAG